MEAIFAIIGELVFAILWPFVAIVAETVGAAISALLSLLFGGPAERFSSTRIARFIAMTLGVFAALGVAVVLVVNFLFFDESIRYVLDKMEGRTGITAQCENIDGSLLSGKFSLRDCGMRRANHPGSSFDLIADGIDIDLRILSLLGTPTLDTARATGLSGWVQANRTDAPGEADHGTVRPRREFEVKKLEVADVSLTLSGTNPDGNPFEFPVEIALLEIEPLRSRFAVFDVLFRSNGTGKLAGAPFELVTSQKPNGRITQWRAEQVPIASFGAATGGALSWFHSGFVDIHVDDEWQRDDAADIDMDWRLNFSGIEVKAPAGTGTMMRFLTAPLTRYVNGFEGDFPLEFSMVLNEDQFEYQSSLAAAGMWTAIGAAANNALSLAGVNMNTEEDDGEGTGNALKESLKSVLDKARKPKDEQ